MRIQRVILYVVLILLGIWALKRTACHGCFGGCWSGKNGSGHVIEQRREVGDFDEIEIDCVIKAELRPSDRSSVAIQTDDNLQDIIETSVEGRRLRIKFKDGASIGRSAKLRALIGVRDLRAISLSGVGDVECPEPLNLRDLSADLSGVGKIELRGACEKLRASNSGAGNIDASQLVAQVVDASNSGVGNIHCRAERELRASNSGVGNIIWSGAATVTDISSSGVGKVKKEE